MVVVVLTGTRAALSDKNSPLNLLGMIAFVGLLVSGSIALVQWRGRNAVAKKERERDQILPLEVVWQQMQQDIAKFAISLRDELNAHPDRFARIQELLAQYGSNKLPDGTVKPIARAATREKVIAAFAKQKALKHQKSAALAAAGNRAAPPQNTAAEPWEIELADWFADLVTHATNAVLSPKQDATAPFGPEVASDAADNSGASDLSYKPAT